jgi:hypothetical protein
VIEVVNQALVANFFARDREICRGAPIELPELADLFAGKTL